MKTMLIAGTFCKKRERSLKEYARNIFATEKLLQKFEFQQELNKNGVWLTVEDTKKRASRTLQNLLDANLIQNGVIVPGILEHIQDVIA